MAKKATPGTAPTKAAAKAAYGAPPDSATPALPLAAYAGHYANAYIGEAVISAESNRLTLSVGPSSARSYALKHFDRDLFIYFPDGETPDKPSAARFAIGPDGKALSVTLESLDDLGLGTLKRVPE